MAGDSSTIQEEIGESSELVEGISKSSAGDNGEAGFLSNEATPPPPKDVIKSISPSSSDKDALAETSTSPISDQAYGAAEISPPEYKSKWRSSSNHGRPQTTESLRIDALDDGEHNDNDGEGLPAFADASNRALHEEIQRLELLRKDMERAVKAHHERIGMIEDHRHEVRQEIEHTDDLMAAKRKEIETEQHLLALSEREDSRYHKEIKEATGEAIADKKRLQAMRSQIDSFHEETEKLKLALNWNQEELEQWAAAAARKEDDNLALQRYARADEAKIKELSLSIENLTKALVQKRALLDNESKQTVSYQTELDRIADNFKAQHEERKEFLKQWQDTVATMRVRDEEINRLSKQYAQVENVLDEQMSMVAKDREALAMIQIENDELEQNAAAVEREVLSDQHELLSAQDSKDSFLEELDALRLEMRASGQSLQEKIAEQRVTQTELEQKKRQHIEFKERYDAIKKRLQDEKKATVSQERVAMDIEKQLEARRKEVKQKDQLLQSLQDKLFKHSQELGSLRKAEADLQVDIKSAQNTYKNLLSKLRDLVDKYARQQEVLYNTEFDLQQMERKVARGLGERSDEEKIQLQARIKELEQDLEAQQKKRKSLSEQRKAVQTELQSWDKRKQERIKQQGIIQDQLMEIELEIDACESNLEQFVKDREEAMISHDVIRLDVRNLCDTLRAQAEEVYSLEEDRETLKESIVAEKEQLRNESILKRTAIRLYEEERHAAVVELNKKNLEAKNLENRYDNMTAKTEDGEEVSHISLLIQAAQRRGELQREGDELDRIIQQKEKESREMKKTLLSLKERNSRYREKVSGKKRSDADVGRSTATNGKVLRVSATAHNNSSSKSSELSLKKIPASKKKTTAVTLKRDKDRCAEMDSLFIGGSSLSSRY